nr:anthranilate synthase component I family protein [Caldalkalibacillus salinus]
MPVIQAFDMSHAHWMALYRTLTQGRQYHALLESGRTGRYSIIGYTPTHVLKGKDDKLDIHTLDKDGQVVHKQQREGDLLLQLKKWLETRQAVQLEGLPDFKGGLLGFFSYDVVRQIESLPNQSTDDLDMPDMYLMAFEQLMVYDHQADQHYVIRYQPVVNHTVAAIEQSLNQGHEWLSQWISEINQILETMAESTSEPNSEKHAQHATGQQTSIPFQRDMLNLDDIRQKIKPSLEEDDFIQAVQKVQSYISTGDVFQVNLSVRQSRPLQTQPIDVYQVLREINPSPYMGYLHFPECQIVSGSPEQLIKVKNGVVNTRPIAGTRPRGQDRQHDLHLAQELINNEKERAEHVMLVDLERNDIGKISRFGTVNVDEFMVIEAYSHVMHIVSNVQGMLAEGHDAVDVIRAVFPGGTITGAPKVRTMEIIEELEPVRRGIYTGSIGWIDFDGDMELNIVIRTMLAKEGYAHVQAGAGIVIDSVPANEYQESLKKAEVLWKAYERSIQHQAERGTESQRKTEGQSTIEEQSIRI